MLAYFYNDMKLAVHKNHLGVKFCTEVLRKKKRRQFSIFYAYVNRRSKIQNNTILECSLLIFRYRLAWAWQSITSVVFHFVKIECHKVNKPFGRHLKLRPKSKDDALFRLGGTRAVNNNGTFHGDWSTGRPTNFKSFNFPTKKNLKKFEENFFDL